MKKTTTQSSSVKTIAYVLAGMMALLPFHAIFTTWLGSTFGRIDLFRIWKELLVITLLPFVSYIALSDAGIRRWLKSSWLVRLVGGYLLLHIVTAWIALLKDTVNASALIYGLLINLRFLGFFMVVLAISYKTDILRRHWRRFVLLPGLLVIGFGILQLSVLPVDFLKHFGYGPDTIPAVHTVDQKLAYRRIQSTLRGPNPLGAYLVMILPLITLLPGSARRVWAQLVGVIVLFFSYSRSAIVGLFATTVVVAGQTVALARRTFIIIIGSTLLVGGLIFAFRDNDIAQNALFHTDEKSRSSVSSNASRLSAMRSGVLDVIHEPLGRGPGTAGPASTRNTQPARLSENYFLQVGQETGVVGVILLSTIMACIGIYLWQSRKDRLAQTMFAVFIGMTVINMVSHAWSDDTLAYLFWGMTGIVLSPVILNKERKR